MQGGALLFGAIVLGAGVLVMWGGMSGTMPAILAALFLPQYLTPIASSSPTVGETVPAASVTNPSAARIESASPGKASPGTPSGPRSVNLGVGSGQATIPEVPPAGTTTPPAPTF